MLCNSSIAIQKPLSHQETDTVLFSETAPQSYVNGAAAGTSVPVALLLAGGGTKRGIYVYENQLCGSAKVNVELTTPTAMTFLDKISFKRLRKTEATRTCHTDTEVARCPCRTGLLRSLSEPGLDSED